MSDTHNEAELLNNKGTWKSWELSDLQFGDSSGLMPGSMTPQQIQQRAYQKGLIDGADRVTKPDRKAAEKNGFTKGYEEGYAAGMTKMKQQVKPATEKHMEQIGALVENFTEAMKSLGQDMSVQLVDLAVTVGQQLARDSLELKPELIVGIVEDMLESEYAASGRPRIYLHPEDLNIVQEFLGTQLENYGWELVADEQLTRGGCIFRSQSEEIDATWETRCETLLLKIRQRGTAVESPAMNDEPSSENSAA